MTRITTRKRLELLVRKKREKPKASRPKGGKGTITRALQGAYIIAAAESQQAKDNGGGIIGYFQDIAKNRPALMARLAYRVMWLQEKELAQTVRHQKH